MSDKGYIKLYRDIQDHWMWKDERFSRGQAWIDLIMMANHKDAKIPVGEHIEIVKRGQFITSIAKLSDRWKWSYNTTKAFLNLLENDNMLIRKSDNSKTLITIVNYGVYQSREKKNEEGVDRPIDEPIDRATDEPTDEQTANQLTELLIVNKNVKNDKNVKNIYISSFEHAWEIYPRKDEKKRAYECYTARLNSGYSEEELLQATEAYAKECEERQTEKRYIKQAKTFFGINEPFVDYLKRAKAQEKKQDLSSFFDINEANNTPPYFGLPKEWFDGETLVESRVEPIWHPRMHGLPEGTESAKEVINTFNWRKRGWYEYNKRKGESSGSE